MSNKQHLTACNHAISVWFIRTALHAQGRNQTVTSETFVMESSSKSTHTFPWWSSAVAFLGGLSLVTTLIQGIFTWSTPQTFRSFGAENTEFYDRITAFVTSLYPIMIPLLLTALFFEKDKPKGYQLIITGVITFSLSYILGALFEQRMFN